MNRGDRREAIFEDDEDRQRLLQTLTEGCEKTGWQVHAKQMGWSEADLKARWKGEPRKVELAWELRAQTTMPLAWIAERLNMGTRGHLAWLLQRRGQSRLAAPADQCLLRI
jgi:hypothetical protein